MRNLSNLTKDAKDLYKFADNNYGIAYKNEIIRELKFSDIRYRAAVRELVKNKLARRRLKRKGGGIFLLDY